MIVVDSSVWIDYLCTASTPETDYLNDILGSRPIGVGDLILAEVLQGFRIQREYDAARRELLEFPLVLMGGRDNAIAAANHYRHHYSWPGGLPHRCRRHRGRSHPPPQ
jgi:predicted nucleic acid-binding protein